MICAKERNLNEWLSYIEQAHSKTIDLSLERVKAVGNKAHWFKFRCPIVMVAGTNGKGSTVACLASLLRKAGLKVGTYTSPHLLAFQERIQLNGRSINEIELCHAFKQVENLRGDISLTFFEFTTLAAFYIFQQHANELDILILEIGLGGRLDAVNVLEPNLAIVTSIGLDHQEYLGDTVDEIAFEKAGILRPSIPVILSQKAKIESLLSQTRAYRNDLFIEEEHFGMREGLNWYFDQKEIKLTNIFLPINSVSLALAAYTILGKNTFSLPPVEEVLSCLNGVMMAGRCQKEKVGRTIVYFDVGHNPAASEWLAKRLKEDVIQGKTIAVWASMADKALKEIVAPLKDQIARWCIGGLARIPRAASVEALRRALEANGIDAIEAFGSISQSFERSQTLVEPNDRIVVFGSFYTVAEIMDDLAVENKALNNNGLYCI